MTTEMKTQIKNLISQIETLKSEYDESLVWGVRCDVAGLPIGHIFEASYVWDDGKWTDEMLKGTCVVEDKFVAREAAAYLAGYPQAYVVCGYHAGYGEDQGEVILTECEVMAIG